MSEGLFALVAAEPQSAQAGHVQKGHGGPGTQRHPAELLPNLPLLIYAQVLGQTQTMFSGLNDNRSPDTPRSRSTAFTARCCARRCRARRSTRRSRSTLSAAAASLTRSSRGSAPGGHRSGASAWPSPTRRGAVATKSPSATSRTAKTTRTNEQYPFCSP